MYLSESDKQKISEILAGEPGIELAYLYGSYASGLAREDSDVDIGILVNLVTAESVDWKYEVDLAMKIENALGKEVDLRTINKAPLYFLDQVVNEGKILFATSDEAMTEFESRIIMKYLDIKPVYDLYEEYRNKRLGRGEFGVKYKSHITAYR